MTGSLAAAGVALLVAVAVVAQSGASAAVFCNANGVGSTPRAAIASYLRACGSDYSVAIGPYDGDKATTPYASYAHLLEYRLNVKNNAEGSLAFWEVGQRTAASPWRTLGPPGTGP